MLLEAEHVKKTYRLGRVSVPVLRDASISIAEGEWVAIVGSSGSGKSTLLHLLGGLDRVDADSGPIRFAGSDLRGFGAGRQNRYRNRDVGFVKRGMPAQIRVDTFPYTQFGSITGRLKSVGTLPVPPDEQNPEPRFPAYVRMDRDYLQKGDNRFPVSAGQSVQVNLVLREKRVISLLTLLEVERKMAVTKKRPFEARRRGAPHR